MARDLAIGRAIERLVAEEKAAQRQFVGIAARQSLTPSGSWLPLIQTTSRPAARSTIIARNSSGISAEPARSWKLSPSETTSAGSKQSTTAERILRVASVSQGGSRLPRRA